MSPNDKAAGVGQPQAAQSKISDTNHTRKRVPLKWQRVLGAFVSGRSLNRFEAERDLHDHCLHTTVSVLQGKGVRIDRKDEVVPGFQQIPTHVCRYWLAPESHDAAIALLHNTNAGGCHA